MADAGVRIVELGNPPDVWLRLLPRYAELQRGEATRWSAHLRAGVPDLRPAVLPERYEAFVVGELPLDAAAHRRLIAFAPVLTELCDQLVSAGISESIQHDDLHVGNVYLGDDQIRVLDRGDASVGHPFWSLVVTFRFLEEVNGLAPDDRGLRGSATRISSPGVPIFSVCSTSHCPSGSSRTPSPRCDSATTSDQPSGRRSTPTSP